MQVCDDYNNNNNNNNNNSNNHFVLVSMDLASSIVSYISILRDLYSGATSALKLHRDRDKIKLERGAR